MNRIIQGIQEFQRNVFPAKRDLFRRLASGQYPEALFIACSDSRVSLEWITQCHPGDLFVCRNAGNMAPEYSHTDSTSATIEYAVSALQVKHIVVCGHSDCGAMKGLLHPEKVAGMPDVRSWLRHAEPARWSLMAAQISADAPDVLSTLAKLNVRLQLDHLRTHPQVLSRIQSGDLETHGWYYEIETGEVLAWDAAGRRWLSIHEVAAASTAALNSTQEAQHA
jgi:carbonic anhydrase